MKTGTETMEVYTVRLKDEPPMEWYGGDGSRIPVWESSNIKEAKQFIKDNKYHRPKLVKATLTYEI